MLPEGQRYQVEAAREGFTATFVRTVTTKDGKVPHIAARSEYVLSRNVTLVGTGGKPSSRQRRRRTETAPVRDPATRRRAERADFAPFYPKRGRLREEPGTTLAHGARSRRSWNIGLGSGAVIDDGDHRTPRCPSDWRFVVGCRLSGCAVNGGCTSRHRAQRGARQTTTFGS